jgi:hypothetical protein
LADCTWRRRFQVATMGRSLCGFFAHGRQRASMPEYPRLGRFLLPLAEADAGAATDARVIMGADEAPLLLLLWREKRGEAEPEDLSGNLIVQLGLVTEALNRHWYECNTGQPSNASSIGCGTRCSGGWGRPVPLRFLSRLRHRGASLFCRSGRWQHLCAFIYDWIRVRVR